MWRERLRLLSPEKRAVQLRARSQELIGGCAELAETCRRLRNASRVRRKSVAAGD